MCLIIKHICNFLRSAFRHQPSDILHQTSCGSENRPLVPGNHETERDRRQQPTVSSHIENHSLSPVT